MPQRIRLEILPQPDDVSCGQTCLHAVYRFFGDPLPLEQLRREVTPWRSGGTLGVDLACHALARGWSATLYTYNLSVFDPTWFAGRELDLTERLRTQAEAKPDPRLRAATSSYLRFLELGGALRHEDLSGELLTRLLRDGPVITGLSATYLYACAREIGDESLVPDDVRGYPTGHFVVLGGYDEAERSVLVADPLGHRTNFESQLYHAGVDRLLGAILLGVLTYDGNLVVLRPRAGGTPAA